MNVVLVAMRMGIANRQEDDAVQPMTILGDSFGFSATARLNSLCRIRKLLSMCLLGYLGLIQSDWEQLAVVVEAC
jgi:hypothetical protein